MEGIDDQKSTWTTEPASTLNLAHRPPVVPARPSDHPRTPASPSIRDKCSSSDTSLLPDSTWNRASTSSIALQLGLAEFLLVLVSEYRTRDLFRIAIDLPASAPNTASAKHLEPANLPR